MKTFYLVSTLTLLVIGASLLLFVGPFESLSWSIGFLVALGNVAVIQYSWVTILGKKTVAWPGTLIVIKYTLLTYLLYVIATHKVLLVFWFTLGLAAVVIPAVVFSLIRTNRGS